MPVITADCYLLTFTVEEFTPPAGRNAGVPQEYLRLSFVDEGKAFEGSGDIELMEQLDPAQREALEQGAPVKVRAMIALTRGKSFDYRIRVQGFLALPPPPPATKSK